MSESVKLLDGALTLYKQPSSAMWWARFYHQRTPYRVSTKATELDKAKETARAWFYVKQAELATGAPRVAPDKTFEAASVKAIAEYEGMAARGERSKAYVREIDRILRNVVNPEIGKLAIDAIDQSVWASFRAKLLAGKPDMHRKTLHQHKMAIRAVLAQANLRGELKDVPALKDIGKGHKLETPRTYFEPDQCAVVIKAIQAKIAALSKVKKSANSVQLEVATELLDFVELLAHTGMRIDELCNVRYCDVTIREETKPVVVPNKLAIGNGPIPIVSAMPTSRYLLIRNIMGKRGRGQSTRSRPQAVAAFERLVKRSGLANGWTASTELLFKMRQRERAKMFRGILDKCGLRLTNDRPQRYRDLKSFRHTYVCMEIFDHTDVFIIAQNIRTSVPVIETHYANYIQEALATR